MLSAQTFLKTKNSAKTIEDCYGERAFISFNDGTIGTCFIERFSGDVFVVRARHQAEFTEDFDIKVVYTYGQVIGLGSRKYRDAIVHAVKEYKEAEFNDKRGNGTR